MPEAWQFLKWTRCIEPGTNVLLSVGAVFRDIRTKGQDLRDYLVCFIIAPERGAICEKTLVGFGKARYETVVSNKTAEKLNEYIKEHYFEAQSPVPESGGLEALREKIANL